uniref:TIR domain-containing protein n=1 Tax=Populus trichocarpa TaxID=3694 RepID=A0A3N7EZ10_POPTR|eukprot:XP_024455703.1 disease resistance protein TAO1 isoform X2 [Populus trichocarpa]
MASTPTITPSNWKYDVFLSFRGADTRNSFTSHLYKALCQNQIHAYIDYKLHGGEKIEPALLERIEESYISVVIFSENYADSTFCLRELSKILECMETKGQKVLPVFHQLDPSHVQDLTGSYGDAICKHESDCSSQEVESWRHASKEIANLKGWDSKVIRDETKLIEEIVSDIQKKLQHMPAPSIDSKRIIGMKSRVEDIESLLSFGSTGVLIVGIWGLGGIGKSTTAEAVYHRNSHKFEGHCFFRNVMAESHKHGLVHVLQEILREVLENKDLNIGTKVLPPYIKRMLQRKKVLIVLDDVNSSLDLRDLLGEDGLFGQGSRIIVTSRDWQVLINACEEDNIYEVKNLNEDDALELFSLHAFRQNNPIQGYTELSKSVVSCVEGIPLFLEALGASLYKKTSVEYWESKVAQLRTKIGEDIKKSLEMCFDELNQTEKKIFLDIACFFGWCRRDVLHQTLDLEERSGIDRLTDMCLIKIIDNRIWMHDMLQKLGRQIVHQENVDPRGRSRLWEAEDVYHVLTNHQGTGKVEAISLDMSATKEMNLSPTAFEGIYNLRLFDFHNPNSPDELTRIRLPRGLQFLSNGLRILYWYNYPLKSLPSNFCPEKLVELKMPCSQLEELWNECQPLENLKLMNLSYSSKLSLVNSDLSKVPNLEVLNLAWCCSLVKLPSSIKYCTRLTELDLRKCESLCTLPSSIGCLTQLVKLNLTHCKGLASLPYSICELKCLATLDLELCSELTSLPSSIGELESLVELNLGHCSKLSSLPNSIGELKCLARLYLGYCSKLTSLPDKIGELKYLKELKLHHCLALASLPNSIGELKSLDNLDFYYCLKLASFPDSIGELNCLATLDLKFCSKLASVPDSFGQLKCLSRLDLGYCSELASLPDSFGDLKCLSRLDLCYCLELASLPDSIGELKSLVELNLGYCSKLASLPDSIGKLKCLEMLDLNYCSKLASLPDSIGKLKSLVKLHLSSCSKLASLPDSIGKLKSLAELHLSSCLKLASLPDSIGELKCLPRLDLGYCLKLN